MPLPEGRKPLSDKWFAQQSKTHSSDIDRMQNSRDFGVNTCPASRHAQMIAEALSQAHSGSQLRDVYPMLEEDPEHCAASIASVVNSLYQARSFLKSLGYTWRVLDNGKAEWYIATGTDEEGWYPGRASRENMSNPGDKNYED